MSTHELTDKNGRIYPADVLRRLVANAKPRIEAGQVIGEVEPPGDGRSRMAYASHVVRGMKVDDKGCIVGTVEFLDTQAGRTAEAMLKADPSIMHGSLRSEVTRDANGKIVDMKPISFDVTMSEPLVEPSAVDQLADLMDEEDG
jgi:hypothetical protein